MENEQQKPMSIFFGDEKGPWQPSKLPDQSEPKTLQILSDAVITMCGRLLGKTAAEIDLLRKIESAKAIFISDDPASDIPTENIARWRSRLEADVCDCLILKTNVNVKETKFSEVYAKIGDEFRLAGIDLDKYESKKHIFLFLSCDPAPEFIPDPDTDTDSIFSGIAMFGGLGCGKTMTRWHTYKPPTRFESAVTSVKYWFLEKYWALQYLKRHRRLPT